MAWLNKKTALFKIFKWIVLLVATTALAQENELDSNRTHNPHLDQDDELSSISEEDRNDLEYLEKSDSFFEGDFETHKFLREKSILSVDQTLREDETSNIKGDLKTQNQKYQNNEWLLYQMNLDEHSSHDDFEIVEKELYTNEDNDLKLLNRKEPIYFEKIQPLDENFNNAGVDQRNFYEEVDFLNQKYSEMRGGEYRIHNLKFTDHWKKEEFEKLAKNGQRNVYLPKGTQLEEIETGKKTKLSTRVYVKALNGHDKSGDTFVMTKKGKYKYIVSEKDIEDLRQVTQLSSLPKEFITYDSPRAKNYYDIENKLYFGPHFGLYGQDAPFASELGREGLKSVGTGYRFELSGFYHWRFAIRPGLIFGYQKTSFSNAFGAGARLSQFYFGPKFRWRLFYISDGDFNITFGGHKSFRHQFKDYSEDKSYIMSQHNLSSGGYQVSFELRDRINWGIGVIGFHFHHEWVNFSENGLTAIMSEEKKYALSAGFTYGIEFDVDWL